MSTKVEDHLTRLLGLVPYAYENPGVSVERAAQDFGITADELISDLNLLWIVGRPGHYHDDLIDVAYEDGHLSITNADEISFPVKLTAAEAQTLLVSLSYLRNFDDFSQTALESLMEKVAKVTGESSRSPSLSLDGIEPAIRDRVREAVSAGRGLGIEYYVPSRDELTVRTVTPLGLRLIGGWKLAAYCHLARDFRLFSVENIRSCELVDDAGVPAEAHRHRPGTAGQRKSR